MSEQITLARAIAYMAHRGQFRKDGVTPYFTHPEAVAESLSKWNEYVIAAALLHDTKEDAGITSQELFKMGVHMIVIDAVTALTHGKNEPYERYLGRVAENEIAKIVKVADIQHNLSSDPSEHQKQKYKKALVFLAKA